MKRLLIATVVGALALVSCGSDTIEDVADDIENSTDVSVSDEVEANAVALAADVEQQMDTLTTEIQSSEAAADLQDAWSNIQGAVTAAIASMQTDGSISTDGLSEAIDEFEAEVTEAGDEIGPEITEAWNSLRSSLEQLMN